MGTATTTTRSVIGGRGQEGWADYAAAWLTPREAALLRAELVERETAFEGGTTLVAGRRVPTPRCCAAFGDEELRYPDLGGSGPWPPFMGQVRDRLARAAGHPFNYALVNWYRDGRDHTGWHADKVHLHEPGTSIAIVSLGASRHLVFRPLGASEPVADVRLEDGSLLWMRGDLQLRYEHAVPVEPDLADARFSVTFRHVLRPEPA